MWSRVAMPGPSGSGYHPGLGPVDPGTQAATLFDPGPTINRVLYEASGSCVGRGLSHHESAHCPAQLATETA
jgi:hypothetical protein